MSPSNLRNSLQASLGAAFTVDRELGRGGMSRVFVARDHALGREIVVKLLPPELLGEISLERFRREVRLAAGLAHANVVPVLSAGEVAGLPYYTMPLVRGESLRARLDRLPAGARLPLGETVSILRDVARALAYAHEHGVVHRDVKPENVLLAGGAAVVTDFGIAKAVSAAVAGSGAASARRAPSAPREPSAVAGAAGGTGPAVGTTLAGVAIGTPAYMAPEQALGDPTVDHRADLYAWGVLAFELLAGHHPFAEARTPEGLAAAHVGTAPPSLAEAAPDAPRPLADMVARCLAKAREHRPPSALALLDALDHLPVAARRGAAAGRDVRRRLRVAALTAALLVPVAGAAWMARAGTPPSGGGAPASGRHPPGPPEPREPPAPPEPGSAAAAADSLLVTVTPFDNRTGDPALDAVASMAADWLTQGLAASGALRVVDARTAPTPLDSLRPGESRVAAAARATGAQLVVVGVLHRDGDSLALKARAVRASDGVVRLALPVVRGPASRPTAVVERASRDYAVALAGALAPMAAGLGDASGRPPELPAYRAMLAAYAQWHAGDYRAALAQVEQAMALDPAYATPVLFAGEIHMRLGDWPRAAAMARRLVAMRPRLVGVEAAQADFLRARVAGDPRAALDAARRAAALAPRSELALGRGVIALGTNRPVEALRAFEGSPPDAPWRRSTTFWRRYATAAHLAGDHARELRIAAEARAVLEGSLLPRKVEATAHAATGRADLALAVARAIPQGVTDATDTPESVLAEAGLELRAHGFAAEGDSLLWEAWRWWTRRSVVERTDRSHWAAASIAYWLGQWQDAERLWAELAVASPDDGFVRARQACVAAHLGQPERARRIAATLDALDPRPGGARALYWQALVAAALGDRERAASLLERSLARGHELDLWFHRDPDLMTLRGVPAYDALMRPKG